MRRLEVKKSLIGLVLFVLLVLIFVFIIFHGEDDSPVVIPNARVFRSYYREMESFISLDLMKESKTLRPLTEFILEPRKITPVKCAKLSMVIFVKSHYNNTKRRDFARSTWAAKKCTNRLQIETIFIVGTGKADRALKKENEKHGDLLQIKFEDTYENLVHKTISGMQWASENIPQDWFYSSMDDDVLPDFTKIVTDIERIIATEKRERKLLKDVSFELELPIYCGFGYRVKTRPKRKGESKWYISEEKYPIKRYPPYCFGGFYTMTAKLATGIFNLSRKMQIFWIDDIWITGMLRLKYLATTSSNCAYCEVNNSTMGLWTENAENYTAAITGDEKYLSNKWRQSFKFCSKCWLLLNVFLSD